MKIRLLYALFGIAFFAVLLLSNAGGPGVVQGLDRTGSPLSTGTCSSPGCHDGGDFGSSIAATLLKNGSPVTQYEPGEDYTFRLTINTSNAPSGYGFHTVALRGTDNLNAGTWDSAPAGFRLTTISNRQYVEHSSPRNSNVLEIKWTAPDAGAGAVRFFASGNAVNRDGTSDGDSPTTLSSPLTINEQSPSAIFGRTLLPAELNVYPNPVKDQLNLNIQIKESGRYFLSIHDLSGKEVQRKAIQLLEGANVEYLDVQSLASGHYTVQISDGERVAAEKILKK